MGYPIESGDQPVARRNLDVHYIELGFLTQRNRQIRRYIGLGFHTVLGMTEEEYASRFPPIEAIFRSFL